MNLRSSGGGLTVSIGPGLPKDSRPGQRERVDRQLIPKSIQVVAPSQPRSGGGPAQQYNQQQRGPAGRGGPGPATRPQSRPPMPSPQQLQQQQQRGSVSGGKRPPAKAPNPNGGALYAEVNRTISRQPASPPPVLPASGPHRNDHGQVYGNANEFLQIPDSGVAGQARKASNKVKVAPPPVAKATKKLPNKPDQYKKCRALYTYEATDVDELSFNEGEIIEIMKEDPSGWWTGRISNRQGSFPSNYIQKI